MQDHEIEQLISRYRPAGPPPELRARALMPRDPRVWPWVTAAAALWLVVLGVDHASQALIVRARVMPGPDVAVVAAETLADAMGGGTEARAVARLLIDEQQWRADVASTVGTTFPSGSGVAP